MILSNPQIVLALSTVVLVASAGSLQTADETGLDWAIDRVNANLEINLENQGLLNAQEHLEENRDRIDMVVERPDRPERPARPKRPDRPDVTAARSERPQRPSPPDRPANR